MRAALSCVGRLIKLTVRHIEEVVHHEGRISALKVVLSVRPSRDHVHVLNLVDQDGWNFLNVAVSGG